VRGAGAPRPCVWRRGGERGGARGVGGAGGGAGVAHWIEKAITQIRGEPMSGDNDRREGGGGTEVAILAGGCFWCLEAVYDELAGVESVENGYIGGHVANPTYEAVCAEVTGHAEAVRIRFDPGVVSFEDLLEVFFAIHDPTTLNRQGADIGTQYRSEVFAVTLEQRRAADEAIRRLEAEGAYRDPIVTAVSDAGEFYPAGAYHEDYFVKNPWSGYCQAVIGPKVAKFRKEFAERRKQAGART
jgi:peptide-methionine (S)-S-oxide reductase